MKKKNSKMKSEVIINCGLRTLMCFQVARQHPHKIRSKQQSQATGRGYTTN